MLLTETEGRRTGLTSSKMEDLAMMAGFFAFFSAYSFNLCSLSFSASSSSSLPNRSISSSSSSSSLTGALDFCWTVVPWTDKHWWLKQKPRIIELVKTLCWTLHLCREQKVQEWELGSQLQETSPKPLLDIPVCKVLPLSRPPLKKRNESMSLNKIKQKWLK